MATVNRNFSQLRIFEFIGKTQEINNNMENSPLFSVPPVPYADLQVALDNLAAKAIAAESRDRDKINARNQQRDIVENMLERQANYVQLVSNGDRDIIELSGFTPSKERQPVMLGVPQGLTAMVSGYPGSVNLRWKATKGAHSYLVQTAPMPLSPESEWTTIEGTTTSKTTVQGLTPGTFVAFRVIALGSGNSISAPSDEVICVVG